MDTEFDLESEAIDNPIGWLSSFAHGREVDVIEETEIGLVLGLDASGASLRLEVQWDEEYETLYMFAYDNDLKMMKSPTVYETLNKINRNTAVGYFTINEDNKIVWRYSILFHGTSHLYETFFEDVLEGVVAEFERFQPIFSLVSHDRPIANDVFDQVIQAPAGEA